MSQFRKLTIEEPDTLNDEYNAHAFENGVFFDECQAFTCLLFTISKNNLVKVQLFRRTRRFYRRKRQSGYRKRRIIRLI